VATTARRQLLRTLIFLAGERVAKERWLALCQGSLLIAADAGLAQLEEAGVHPDVLLGDFDSIANPEGLSLQDRAPRVLVYPEEKDQTDGEIAVEYALAQGAREVVLVGGWGRRADHALANVLLLVKLHQAGAYGWMLNQRSEMVLVQGQLRLGGRPGQTFSLLPLTPCRGVSLRGGRYPMKDAELNPGETWGISNQFFGEEVMVENKKGLLLAILSLEERAGEGV
jgi:thiamine pyrophosphokinase